MDTLKQFLEIRSEVKLMVLLNLEVTIDTILHIRIITLTDFHKCLPLMFLIITIE
jgi:hypothetical protein